MRLTWVHAKYWRSRQKAPGWVLEQERRPYVSAVSIHACVNAHAGIPMLTKATLDTQNTLAVLRMHRANKVAILRRCGEEFSFLPYLDHLAYDQWTLDNMRKRAALARKWARRIRRAGGAQA